MATTDTYVSLYDRRVKIVSDVLRQSPDLTEDAAIQLAKRALYALDHIPEKVR